MTDEQAQWIADLKDQGSYHPAEAVIIIERLLALVEQLQGALMEAEAGWSDARERAYHDGYEAARAQAVRECEERYAQCWSLQAVAVMCCVQAIRDMQPEQRKDGWILTTTKQPEPPGTSVLVYGPEWGVMIAGCPGALPDWFTHWMPLPEPPEEVEE